MRFWARGYKMNVINKIIIFIFFIYYLNCNQENVKNQEKISIVTEKNNIEIKSKYDNFRSGKVLYITAKGGLWARNEPSLTANKMLLYPESYKIGLIHDVGSEPVTIDGITDYWVAVWEKGNIMWVFGGYLSASPKLREINGIPLDKDFCLKFTQKTFPDKFEGGCWGWECLFLSGAVDYRIFSTDYTAFILLQKNNKGEIVFTENRDDTSFKNITWKKEKDSIIVSGLYKHRKPNFYDDGTDNRKWINEQKKNYGKENFFIDFTLKILMNKYNNFEFIFHALDKNPVNGKKIAEYLTLDNELKYPNAGNCLSPL
jgi:hypothetical protein